MRYKDVHALPHASMASLLAVVGGHHWTPEQVAAHKAAELAKAPPASRWWPYFSYIFYSMEALMLCCLVAMTIGGLGTGLFIFLAALAPPLAFFGGHIPFLAGYGSTDLLLVAFYCGVVLLAAFGFGTIVEVQAQKISIRPPAAWEAVGATWFSPTIPLKAQQLIAYAKEFNPNARIIIHALMQRDRVLDPILEIDGVVCLVWDEAGTIVLPHD